MKEKPTISPKLEEKVAEMLLRYCNWKSPSKEDLNTYLNMRGFSPYKSTTSTRILEICERILIIDAEKKFEYKGFTIEKEKEPWALKYNLNIKFYQDETILHATTIEEAKDEIDERTSNKQEHADK